MHSESVSNRWHVWQLLVVGVAAYAATSLLVLVGVVAGIADNASRKDWDTPRESSAGIFLADAAHYLEIAREGYHYDPSERSTVAFFPFYPLAARTLAKTGIGLETSLMLTASGLLIGAFVLLALFANCRAYASAAIGYTVLAFGLFPPTFFFRMGYAESSFLFLAILAMIAMQRGWPTYIIAIAIGFVTSTRPVGVALVPVFWLYVAQTSTSRRMAWFRAAAWTPIALSGLIAYMVYQHVAFGDALAFAKTQDHWCMRNNVSAGDKTLALLSYEPIWSVYNSGAPEYWCQREPGPAAAVNLAFANPIYFLLGVGLLVFGAWRKWLNGREALLGALLFLIPYITRSYEMCMLSQGRFMAADFPIYLVMGQLLSRIPGPLAALILSVFAVYLAIYTIHFAAGYPLI